MQKSYYFRVIEMLVLLAAFALQAGPKADADLAKIADHFTKTSAAFEQSKSNWRWVFYGDSITHGCAHTHGWRNFVEIVEERIRWEKAALFDTVINSGNSGYSSIHLVNPDQYDWQVASLKPNVVFILIGCNDIVLPDANMARFRENVTTLVKWVRRDGAIPVLQTYHTIKLFRNPTAKWQFDYVKRYDEQPLYNEVVREIAAAEDVILVDHEKYWKENASDPAVHNFWMAEHIHPGARGHLEMARLIITTLGLDKGGQGNACLNVEAGGKQPASVADVSETNADDDAKLEWSIDEDGAAVLNGGKWNCIGAGATVAGDVLKLEMSNGNPNFTLTEVAKLNSWKQEAVLEIEMRMLSDADANRSNRFYLAFVAGEGATYTEPLMIMDASDIRGTAGNYELPIELNKFFTLRVQLKPQGQQVTLYVDGKPIGQSTVSPYTNGVPRIIFGKGSPSISGTIEIRHIRLGGN